MKSLNDSLDECKKSNPNGKLVQSYQKYLQRLKTFELFKWFAKPIEFSPIECARRGWINFNKDTLKCVACSSLFYFYTQPSFNKFQNNEKKTTSPADPKSLVEKHNPNCPWRTLIVPDQLIEVDVIDDSKAYSGFLTLRETFRKCSKVPSLSEKNLKEFDFGDLRNDSRRTLRDRIVDTLAVCGWQYKEDKDILTCEKCLRTIGLWLYKQELNEASSEESLPDSSNEASKENNSNTSQNENIFADTEPYSDENAIKVLMDKLIQEIEVDHQTSLLTAAVASSVFPETIDIDQDKAYPIKKRKLPDSGELSSTPLRKIARNNLEIMDNSFEAVHNRKKKSFDTVAEHFQWCPWVAVEHASGDETSKNNHNRIESDVDETVSNSSKNMCQANFCLLVKHLSRSKPELKKSLDRSVSIAKASPSNTIVFKSREEMAKESEAFSQRVKSIKSLLINCTTQFSN